MRVGVVGFQGAVSEHIKAVERTMRDIEIDGKAIWVKSKSQLSNVDAVIIPGGESTTIGQLMRASEIFGEVRKLGAGNLPILGTCAGSILLAKEGGRQVKKTDQPLLKLMDIKVERNAFGSQKESFEAMLEVSVLGNKPFPGVFIRSPAIVEIGNGVSPLASFKDKIVAAEEDNLIATAFHPELTSDGRIHEYFLRKV